MASKLTFWQGVNFCITGMALFLIKTDRCKQTIGPIKENLVPYFIGYSAHFFKCKVPEKNKYVISANIYCTLKVRTLYSMKYGKFNFQKNDKILAGDCENLTI